MKFVTVGLGGTTVTRNGEVTDAPWLCPIVASSQMTKARKRRITGAGGDIHDVGIAGTRCSRLDALRGNFERGIQCVGERGEPSLFGHVEQVAVSMPTEMAAISRPAMDILSPR